MALTWFRTSFHLSSVLSVFLFYSSSILIFFFFNDTAPTEIYTLSLHDALPIFLPVATDHVDVQVRHDVSERHRGETSWRDRKSTRLNSSHRTISYAVFCLKKKKIKTTYELHTN